MYNGRIGALRVLLVHPGGPYWRRRDLGAWSIPKGNPEPGEDFLAAARREFKEETGFEPAGPYLPLAPQRQSGGKLIYCWACRGAPDLARFRSGLFEMEWPPHSGERASFPEADRAEFFSMKEASRRVLAGQRSFLGALQEAVGGP